MESTSTIIPVALPAASSVTISELTLLSKSLFWAAYHALQADVTKRVSRGVEVHAAYTWGKSIDTLSATAADDAFINGLFNQLFFDQRTTGSPISMSHNVRIEFYLGTARPRLEFATSDMVFQGLAIGRPLQSKLRTAFHANFGR
jgi:hypothetical protein